MNHNAFVRQFPLVSYFALVYTLTWASILLIAETLRTPSQAVPPAQVGLVALLMLLAPGIAGVGLTFILEGRSGGARHVDAADTLARGTWMVWTGADRDALAGAREPGRVDDSCVGALHPLRRR
jgi:hypothetical protein